MECSRAPQALENTKTCFNRFSIRSIGVLSPAQNNNTICPNFRPWSLVISSLSFGIVLPRTDASDVNASTRCLYATSVFLLSSMGHWQAATLNIICFQKNPFTSLLLSKAALLKLHSHTLCFFFSFFCCSQQNSWRSSSDFSLLSGRHTLSINVFPWK